MIKVGIVGAGFMGKTHAQVYKLLEAVEISAITEASESSRSNFVSQFGGNSYATLDDMLSAEELDIIDICLPTFLHKENVIKSAKANINVICEKPIALTISDADEMIEACKNIKFMVAHVLRFWPDYQVIKNILDSGELGSPQVLIANRLSAPPDWAWANWFLKEELSGGVPVDLSIHDLDFCAWVLGKPRYVFAQGKRSAFGAFDTIIATTYQHSRLRNATCSIVGTLSMAHKFAFTSTLTAICEAGSLEFNSRSQPSIIVYPEGKEPYSPEVPTPLPPHLSQMPEAIGNIQALGGYFVELQHFVECVKGNKPPTEIVTPEDARDALKISLAVKESAASGKIVELSW